MRIFNQICFPFLLICCFGCGASTHTTISDDTAEPIRVYFFDIGEGDATLIRLPSGESILVDAGNIIAGAKLVEELKRQGVSQLELLVLTHPHPDHTAGAFTVAGSFPVKEIWENGEDLRADAGREDFYRWYVDYFRITKRAKTVAAGIVKTFDGVTIQVLAPSSSDRSTDWNANSLVLLMSYGEFRLLLTGDANSITEAALIRSGVELSASVLKVGHHGADDASGAEFLARVRPKLAVISVNRNNIRGYPGTSALARLKVVGARVLRTDLNGTIRVIGFHDGRYLVDGIP